MAPASSQPALAIGDSCNPAAQPLADPSEAARVKLAASPQTAPDMLQGMAADPSVTVRAALALNPSSPSRLHQILAHDTDERVRALLGRRLALLLPALASTEREDVGRQALTTLATLVEDEAMRVRSAIADALKEMPDAPRGLILRLAHDSAVPVCEPILRLSPVLTPEDLLALLEQPPSVVATGAIARRAWLDEAVCDRIAASADSVAIAAMLANSSAAIREATLDALVMRASGYEEWHDPLVRRPRLSARAARLLSDVVANHLLEVLAARGDLDQATIVDLQQRISRRLAPARAQSGRTPLVSAEEAEGRARSLFSRGLLDEVAVQDAAQRGELRLCAAMLGTAADVGTQVVERAAKLRNAKGLVSLVWAGGFSMKLGITIQAELGALAPTAMMRPTAQGEFPLDPDEMRWQLELLKRAGVERT